MRSEITTLTPPTALLGTERLISDLGTQIGVIPLEDIRQYTYGVTANGLVVTVLSFAVDNFTFDGGTFTVLPNGTWYIGVELSSKQLRAYPRRGHRGCVFVCKVVSATSTITSMTRLRPEMPHCRIPRTMYKLQNGIAIKALIMGSSLTQSSGAATDWPGMIFGSGDITKYKLPGTVTATYKGVGGSTNQYQLSQLGFASGHTAFGGFTQSGFPLALTNKPAPNGRSVLFKDVDIVVVGCLANGGDYRLENIEQIVRRLRQLGKEVILVTDNPQNPGTDYPTMSSAALYVDGPEVMRIADLYGCELADTASYVFEAQLRANSTGIYADSIHQASGTPTGPNAVLPANGHEAWARAVRSVFPLLQTTSATVQNVVNGNFAAGTTGWTLQNGGVISVTNGQFSVVSGGGAALQCKQTMPAILPGSTVTISVDLISYTGNWDIGLLNAGAWDGNPNGSITSSTGISGVARTITKTFTNVNSNLDLVFWNSGIVAGNTIVVDNVSVTSSYTGFNDQAPARKSEIKPVPPSRIVTDLKTPGDTFIILPKEERYYATANGAKGTLGAHPWGANSFARSFTSVYASTEDMLTLGNGNKAMIAAPMAVGFTIIHYRDVADGGCTFTVSRNGAVFKTVTITTVPFANEWILPIVSPSELNGISALTVNGNDIECFEITVTSGSLKIAALVGLTADITYVRPEEIMYEGTWLANEVSASSLPGKPTDVANSTASLFCTGRRVSWVLSSNAGTKNATVMSGSELQALTTLAGVSNVKNTPALYGPNERHLIRCDVANGSGSQATGHALHVGGAFIIHDR